MTYIQWGEYMKMINRFYRHIVPFAICLILAMVLPLPAQIPVNMEEVRTCLEQVRQLEMRSWQEAIAWEKKHADRDLNFDSRYVQIDIEVHFNDSTINATTATRFRSLVDGLSDIMLDFDDAFTIDSVFNNGAGFTLAGESLIVSLDQTYDSGEVFTVATTYHGHPRIIGGTKGFRFVSHQGIPVVATLCTPYLAHTWWPCVDGPADKLDSVHVNITIPDTSYGGYPLYAASNGKLVGITPAQTGWVTYEWHENYPIVPYYVSIAISNYLIFSHYYHYAADSMEVPYYVFPEHYAQAQQTFAETVDMITFYAGLYGEYPFVTEKYSMAEIGFYGAIEKQTKTIMGNVSSSWYMIVVHELSHMWFGDMISPTSWHHCWINEGFATYSEALWWEGLYGLQAYHDYMDDMSYWDGGTIYLPDISNPFQIFLTICYDKGAWVLHMLRHVIGDSVFFDALYSYATDPQYMYGNASTEDVQHVFETVSGLNLSDFFQQWIYDERYPRYYYWWTYTEQKNGRYQIQVTVEQRQQDMGWRPVFVMPVDLVFTLPSGDTTVVVQNNDTLQTYQFDFGEIPVALSLDPDRWILRYAIEVGIEEKPVDVIPAILPAVRCNPNPAVRSVYIEYHVPLSGECKIELYDVAGNRVLNIADGLHGAGVYNRTFDTGDLPAGVYYVRLMTERNAVVEKVVLLE
jgi:aminopeptidase N